MSADKRSDRIFIKTTKKQGSLPGVDMSKVFESKPLIVKEDSEHLYTKPYSNKTGK